MASFQDVIQRISELAAAMGDALQLRGVKPGGTAGQVPVKGAGGDFDWEWESVSGVGGGITTFAGLTDKASANIPALNPYVAPVANPTFTGTVTIPTGANIAGYLTTAAAALAYQPLGSYAPASGISPSAITGTAVTTSDPRLSDARTPTAHDHDGTYVAIASASADAWSNKGAVLKSHADTGALIIGTSLSVTHADVSAYLSAGVQSHPDSEAALGVNSTGIAELYLGSSPDGGASLRADNLTDFHEYQFPNRPGELAVAADLAPYLLSATAADLYQPLSSYAPASGIFPTAITGTAVIDNDPRLSDARTPTAHDHDSSYAPATGIAPTAITGTAVIDSDPRLSDDRTPTAHDHDGSYAPASGIAPSAITGTAVTTSDPRLSDARTPTAHTHVSADISDASAGGNGAADAGKAVLFDAAGGVAHGIPTLQDADIVSGTSTTPGIPTPEQLKLAAETHSSGGSPGGASGDVQYNNAGAFGAVSGFTLSSGVLQSATITNNFASATPNTALSLLNTTEASSGNQRSSPRLILGGKGHGTTLGTSQDVQFSAYVLPVQGAAPTGTLAIQSKIAGGAWTDRVILGSNGNISSSGIATGNSSMTNTGIVLGLASGSLNIYTAYLTAGGPFLAPILRQGVADAASPVPQTFAVQSVSAGTSNTAGANRTFSGSQGTGTGVGGDQVFTVATAGSTGPAQNALVEALRIKQDRSVCIANVSSAPSAPASGGILYVEAGALKYIGSSGTVSILGAA